MRVRLEASVSKDTSERWCETGERERPMGLAVSGQAVSRREGEGEGKWERESFIWNSPQPPTPLCTVPLLLPLPSRSPYTQVSFP